MHAAQLGGQPVERIVGIGKGILRGGVRGHHAGDILVGDAVGLRRFADDIGGAFGPTKFVVGV